MANRVRYDEKVEQAVVDMYREGKSTAQICETTGVAAGTIYTILRRHGAGPNRQRARRYGRR